MKTTAACILVIAGFGLAHSAAIGSHGGEAKSIGLYSSLDGSSFMWANTSAVSTAGFFGNAAVLLAGVYLLSHSDQIVDIAEGVNSLLPPERKIEGVGENENVLQMLEKGGDLLGDTLETFNQRMTRITDKMNTKSGGLLKKLSQLDNPIKKLKDKLFPDSSPATLSSSAAVPPPPPPLSLVTPAPAGPQVFSIDNSAVFSEDFFSDTAAGQKFNFGKRTSHKDAAPMILVFPDSDLDYDYDYADVNSGYESELKEILYDEEAVTSPGDVEVSVEDIEDEEKLEQLEKKRIWAENFLKNYYKLQEMKQKKEEEKKKAAVIKQELEEKKAASLKTHDMQSFVHLNPKSNEEPDPYVEAVIDDNKGREHMFSMEPQNREIEDKLSGFSGHGGLRIVDEELQSIIDSQLKNFESFKIPKSEPEEEDELETLRKKALKVYESQMERTVEMVEARELPEETTTSSYGFADYIEDNTGRSLIETSTGDDVFVVDEFVD